MKEHQIFIIDDSSIQLVLLEKVLKEKGFTVKPFSNGYNLLQALDEEIPDLIISDIDMPELNGFDLVEKVNNIDVHIDIPIFLISSNGDAAIQDRAEAVGADLFLQKPFRYHVLIDVVRDMLNPVEA